MKNTSNALRRVMSVVLVFAMMFTSMPTGALAEDVVDPAPSATAAEPAASETTEPTTSEPASSEAASSSEPASAEAAPAAANAVLPANDGEPAPVTFTVTFVANGETLVTQTIQQGGSAVAPDAPLVSGQRFVRWDTDFTNVQSDLTVTAVYEAITAKNMTVEYRYSDGTQAAPAHVEQAVVGEPFHKTVPSPALDGFTPDKAEAVFAVESVTDDVTIVVTYSGAARNYTVKHLFQNVEGTAYAEDEALRETLEGTTGLDTAAQAKTVEGFTALPIAQVKVASSGETVVEVKYDRNSYLLTWNTDGGSYVEPQMLKYGAAVSAPADPTKVGYTFAGWDFVPETMPAAATTVTAQWANATQASYQVVYWGENLTGGYDYLYADKATGAVGGNISYSTSLTGNRMPQGLEAAGFELDSAKSAGNVEITADGSAVKNVYFSRKTFTVTFYLYEKSGWFGGEWKEQGGLTIRAKYGEDVSAQWNDSAHSHYMWYTSSSCSTSVGGMKAMPAENLNRYGKDVNTVKIYYKTQNIRGTGYDTYMEGVLPSGWTINEGDIIEIEGFTYERMNKNEKTLYYTRNSYNVVFQNCTGVSQKSLKFGASLSSAKPADSSVGRPAGMDSDYVFMGWYFDPAFQTPVDWSSTMPARNLQVYAKWAKPDYTVFFNTHGADTETPAPIGVAKYDTIEDQMPADPTREGYVFAGWYTDEAYTVPFVATQQIVRNLTLHAKWTRTDSCTYVIVAKDAEGNELKRVDGSEVEVGASVTVNAPAVDGYQARQNSQNVKILDDGQEVVFVYDKLQNWTATVHHLDADTNEPVAPDKVVEDLTVNSLLVYSATVSGYELAGGTSYVQTATRENSEITFYYKKIADSAYTVKHYYGSNASLTETVTGTAKAGSLVTADVINKAGYTCVTSGAALSAYVAKDGSTVINVYYAANDQTYSVYYYLEGTETPVPGTTAKENVPAKFDETVTETAPAATGYTVAGDSTRSITVGADNAANKIVFYYTVNSYPLNITYKYADDVPDAALRGQQAAEPVSRDIAFGAPYSVASPLIPGYTASVAAVAGTMAENGVTVEVVYRAATDTAYTVKHMLQDVTGDGYTEDTNARQTMHGTTGADTNAAAKSYEGFTAQAVAQQVIAADGKTVVEIKYDRNVNAITYKVTGGFFANDSYKVVENVRFGTPLSLIGDDMEKQGYVWHGWAGLPKTMPDGAVEVTGYYTAATDTAYKVEHYLQNLADDEYTLKATVPMKGTTGEQTNAQADTYEGFTVQAFEQQAIAADGSTVVQIYYNRNKYSVHYQITGEYFAEPSYKTVESIKFGTPLTLIGDDMHKQGYVWSGWNGLPATMPAHGVTVTGSYSAATDTAYTVKHMLQDVTGDGYTEDTNARQTMHGTTGADTNAAAKSYEGFTAQAVAQQVIAADGKTVVEIKYDRNVNAITYKVTGGFFANDSYKVVENVRFGTPLSLIGDDMEKQGYVWHGWAGLPKTMPDGAVEVTGYYTAATDTAYKVEHYLQNLADDEYTLKATVPMKGTTGEQTNAQADTYEGFTVQAFEQKVIAADGSTVVKIKYDRSSYEVSYAYTGNVPAGASALPAAASHKYGADVTVAPQATAPGYTFNGWLEDGKVTASFKMPAGPVQLTGSFAANTDTRYTVEHWTEDLDGEGYTLRETEANLTGVTDTTATAEAKSYEGFRFDEDNENNVLTGVITGDGKLVLKVYYARNSYEVSYDYGAAPTSASPLPETASYKYGAEVKVAADATAPGYTFDGWKKDNAEVTSFTMPAGAVQLTGRFTANTDTGYKVEHYQQNLAGDAFVLFETEERNATTDTRVSATPKDYTGFTYDGTVDGTVTEGNVAGDGSLVLKLYYTRDSYKVTYQYTGKVPTGASELPAETTEKYGAAVTVAAAATAPGYTFSGWSREDGFTMPAENVTITGSFTANGETPYKVEHYQQNLEDDGYTLADTENLTGETDTTATANPKTYTGFAFDGTAEGTVASGNIAGDGSLVLKLYYTRNSYDVTYAYTGTVPTGASALPEKATVKYGAPVTVAEAATAPGYTFSGWSRNDFTMPAENVTITGSFTANSNTEYTVRHHFQNILDDAYDADTAMLSETLSGTTDTLTAAAAKTVAGFTAQSFQQKNIAGDGSTVVDIYYNRNSYTVTYAVTGTVDPNPNYKQADYRFGQNVAAEAAAAKAGYDFIGWANEPAAMPANDVTATGYFVARTDTAYQVQHYKQNLEDDGFTLAETEELTGKTDTIATANPKTYTGFTLDRTVEGTAASGNIAGDGSLVLKLYYTRNSYDVTYAYTGTVPTGASALPEKATVKYGAPVTVAEAATAPGYTFSGWSRNDFTMPAENVTITGSFTANSNTEYTVRHHFQNILDDAYDADTAMLSETLSGTTDTLTAAAAKTVAGFTAQSFQQKNIAGDGSTVVDIYYNRNSYGVSYRYLNTPAGASALPAGASYRFGAAVTVAEAATAPGYTFSGWSIGDFTMPAQDVEITGSFTANGDTAYTVEHYQQNLAGDGYDLVEADTEHLTGETDTTATANPKTYTGFTFDGTVEGTVASGNIAGDGSLVLKLYYTRNSYEVSYAYTGTVPADASALPEKAAVKYGAPVTVAEAATAKGHTFSGWSTGDFTMPAQDVEITGSFTANPYNVTVEYYFDKTQDTDMTRVQSVTYGETFTTAAAAETDRNGVHYTLDWVENNGLTVSDIEADNVVRVYYAKDEEGGPDDIPDYAQIVFTYQSADIRKGTVDKSVEIHTFERLNGELLEEKKASPAGANAAGREGYAFDYWTDGTKRDVTSGMETLKSEVYTDNAEFTAYFDVDTKGTDPENPDKPDNVPDKYQAKVTYQAVNGAVTLGGSTGTELVTYVTLFDADGKWAENGTGKLDEAQVPAAAAAADYDPATERWTPAVPAEGAEITADGAVFTVTWELAISGYQVHYYYDGVEDTASAVNATGKIGDAIPYDTGKTTFDGANYVLENVDGAGKLISKDAAANIVNVNFTKDEKSDPTKDPDPEVPGDNIPDKYQATVTFEAINGVLQPKGGTDAQNTKQMTTVVTLLNENGEPAENGTGYLTEAQIPTALANLGYIANTLFWGPATPTTSYAITGDITFVADFNAEGVIPEEPPVPPVTPVGPTAPEEGPEETIDEPETPLAPAEPEAPAEEPAEEEIEEADTPLASGAAWALLNLILMLCTALVSILLLIGFLGKKKKEDENENVEYTVKRKGVTRVLSLIPAIGSIIAFLLTENMRNPMVFVDRWTWLMVLIALVQVIVCIFARKEKEEPDDNAQTPAQA